MIAIRQFLEAVRKAITNLRALALSIVLYALLLASLYIFVSTREATVMQVLITFTFLFLIPAEFFLLQANILAQFSSMQSNCL
jgi:hypothetical protein